MVCLKCSWSGTHTPFGWAWRSTRGHMPLNHFSPAIWQLLAGICIWSLTGKKRSPHCCFCGSKGGRTLPSLSVAQTALGASIKRSFHVPLRSHLFWELTCIEPTEKFLRWNGRLPLALGLSQYRPHPHSSLGVSALPSCDSSSHHILKWSLSWEPAELRQMQLWGLQGLWDGEKEHLSFSSSHILASVMPASSARLDFLYGEPTTAI